MSDEYERSIGIWKHTIGDITHNLIPEEQDNIEFVKIRKEAQAVNDESILTEKAGELYFKIVTRSPEFKQKESVLNETEKEARRKNLKKWIALNINQIITDMLIAYKWTTAEKLKQAEERQLRIDEEIQKKKALRDMETPEGKKSSKP